MAWEMGRRVGKGRGCETAGNARSGREAEKKRWLDKAVRSERLTAMGWTYAVRTYDDGQASL